MIYTTFLLATYMMKIISTTEATTSHLNTLNTKKRSRYMKLNIHVMAMYRPRISISDDARFVLTLICFVVDSCFIYVICICFRVMVFNTISISDDAHVI